MNLTEHYARRNRMWWLNRHIARHFQPTKSQASIINSKSRKRVVTGNRRSGKSALLCMDALERAHRENCMIIMFGVSDYQTRYLVDTMREIIDRSRIPIVHQENMRIVFPNGSRIRFEHGKRPVHHLYGRIVADHYYVDDFEGMSYEVMQFINDCVDVGNETILIAGDVSAIHRSSIRETYEELELRAPEQYQPRQRIERMI